MPIPKVSIGLPVYNGDKYLKEVIESILHQTFQDFELIISDNCSTDKTRDICKWYADKDTRIRYYGHDVNRGAAWNYNYVFKRSRGRLFRWSACDDLFAPDNLRRCVQVMDLHPDVILCYPKTINIDENGKKLEAYQDNLDLSSPNRCERFDQYLFRPSYRVNVLFGLIRREVLSKTCLIGNYNSSDEVLLAELALLGKFYEIPEALFFRRYHKGMSLSANADAKKIAIWFDPSKRKLRFVLPILNRYFYTMKSIIAFRMSPLEKMSCLIKIFRKIWWSKTYIIKEMHFMIKSI